MMEKTLVFGQARLLPWYAIVVQSLHVPRCPAPQGFKADVEPVGTCPGGQLSYGLTFQLSNILNLDQIISTFWYICDSIVLGRGNLFFL